MGSGKGDEQRVGETEEGVDARIDIVKEKKNN
jgi:hypothetical protein